jgi:hypothetical protein
MTIFTIAHTDYETYCPHHLIAPEGTTPEQFTKLCDDLIEPARPAGVRIVVYESPSELDVISAIEMTTPPLFYTCKRDRLGV